MRRNNTYKMKRKAGFTLVEMIVVLVMLAILAAVAVPTYTSYVDSNKAKQCEVERKAIASRLEEMQTMQVTGSDSAADTTKYAEYVASQECPAGGAYTFENNTIVCSHPEHGETTVLLKTDIGVTAKASTQTENSAPPQTDPPQTDPPVTPKLSLSISPNPVPAMEIGATDQLTANSGSPEHCTVNDYEWRSDNNSIVSVDRNGQTVIITAVGEGTCTIYCKAKATASEEAGGQSFDSAEVGVQVTVNPAPSLSIALASAQTLSVLINTSQQIRVTSNPVRCNQVSYDWQVTNGSATTLSIMNNSDGSATVTASEAGDYTVTCLATAISEVDSSTIIPSSNQVTVNIKVASLSISVDPNSVSEIEVGSTIKLTAIPNYKNCTVNGWQWDTSDWNTVKINEGWGTSSIVIEPQKVGTCNITCYATAAPNGGGDNISSNIVTIPVMVKETESESDSGGGLLTGVPNPYLIEKNTNGSHVHGDLARFEAVKDGVWSSSNPDIAQFVNTDYEKQKYNKAMDVKQTGELDLTYTVNGQSQTIHAKVVSSHTYLNVGVYIKDQIISDGNKFYVPGEATIKAVYGVQGEDWVSTDGPVIWEILTPDVIEAVSVTGEHNVNENFTVRAKTAGIAKVKARLQYEFSGTWDEKVISFIVYGEDENQLIGISADPMTITPGKKQTIKFNYSPWNANTDGVKYIYSGYDEECISINSETNEVTALAEGSTKVKVEAVKDGIVLAECEFDVTVAQITSVRLEPGDMILCPNESIPAEIKYEPADADLSDIDFEITGYDTNNIEITWTDETHVTITAGENTGEWWPTVQAKKRTDSANALKRAQFHVKVTKIKSINVDPNPVTFTPNEEKTVKLVVDPLDADLTGLTFELSRWGDLPEFKSVDTQKKTITIQAHGKTDGDGYQWQTLSVKEKGNELANCSIQTKVEAAMPLTGFSIDDISVQEDSTAKVVMHLVPENADLTGVEFNYQCADATAASVTADGVVEGFKAGKSTRVTASASKFDWVYALNIK